MVSSFNPLLSATLTALCFCLRSQEAGDKFRLCVTADTVPKLLGKRLDLFLGERIQFLFGIVPALISISVCQFGITSFSAIME